MRHHTLALCSALIITAPTLMADTPPADESRTAASIASSYLVMQPGDQEKISRSNQNPLRFTQIQNRREFSGTLFVRSKAKQAGTAADRIAPLVTWKSSFVDEFVLAIPQGMNESTLATILMATGDYEFAVPNWSLFPTDTTPNDPAFEQSWQHDKLQSQEAWDLNTGSSSVIIAVCDTGIDLDHPDLEDALVSGFNSWTGIAQADGGIVSPSSGHGTIVAGCAAAIGNNGIGPVGVGWNFSIMPIRITHDNGTTAMSQISEGARWAAENGARIVNVSFSGATLAPVVPLARDLKALGSLLFYAAGNDNQNIEGPRPDFIIVSATTSSDTKWGSSNFGTAVGLSAPGSGVTSTTNGGGFGNRSGTSFASPIAAGVGAMVFSVNPNFGPDDVQDILYTSADDLGTPGYDTIFGNGRVNTFNAITTAQNYTPRTLIPIAQSFESESWTSLLTATSGDALLLADPQAPDGSSVLLLDNTDVLESAQLAARPALTEDYLISLMVKAEGVEVGKSLEIQFRDAQGTWTPLIVMPSHGIDTNGYVRIEAPLATEFAYHGVTIRILANGSDSSDTWMIDDLRIEPMPPLASPFTDNFDSGVLSAIRWDQSQTSADAGLAVSDIALKITGDQAAETNDIDIELLGLSGAFTNFFASTTDAPNTDQLIVEYRDFQGTWLTLDAIDASDLSASPKPYSYELSVFAASPTFRLRISDTSAPGGFFVDNLEIGPDPLPLGCSQADLADPLGTLDIFDVFAFIAAFNAGDMTVDFTGDGTLDIFDLFAFIETFNAGCP